MFDLAATYAKAVKLINEAADAGAQVIVFPELYLPGYAWWLWTESFMSYASRITQYTENCPEVGGPEYAGLEKLAKERGVYVVMGAAERHGSSRYISQWIFGPEGVIATRRKLKPTAVERCVTGRARADDSVLYGEGDGSDLKVHDTPLGRLGALNCWEHLQPLIKHVMGTQHEEIHAASWPTFLPDEGPLHGIGPTSNIAASRVYALEVGCAVIAASSPMTPACIDAIALDNAAVKGMLAPGGAASTIFDSDGRQVSKSLPHDEEGIVYADLNLGNRVLSGSLLDTTGHYLRPDVFRVEFRNEPNPSVVTATGVTPSRQTRAEMYPAHASAPVPTALKPAEKGNGKTVVDDSVNGENA